jgi:hypothetical protein
MKDVFLGNMFGIITDKSNTLSRRIKYLLLLLFVVLFLNDYTGFIFNYRMNQRIEQLTNIYELYPESNKVYPDLIKTLNEYENQIIDRKNIPERIYEYYTKGFFEAENNVKPRVIYKTNWWRVIFFFSSSSIMFLIIGVVLPFMRNLRLRDKLSVSLALLFISGLYNFLIVLIIPLFKDMIYINYLINLCLQFLLFWGLIQLGKKK